MKESGKLEYQSPNVQMQFGYDHVNFVDKKHQVSYVAYYMESSEDKLYPIRTQNSWTNKAPFLVATHMTPGKMDAQNGKMLSWKNIDFYDLWKSPN